MQRCASRSPLASAPCTVRRPLRAGRLSGQQEPLADGARRAPRRTAGSTPAGTNERAPRANGSSPQRATADQRGAGAGTPRAARQGAERIAHDGRVVVRQPRRGGPDRPAHQHRRLERVVEHGPRADVGGEARELRAGRRERLVQPHGDGRDARRGRGACSASSTAAGSGGSKRDGAARPARRAAARRSPAPPRARRPSSSTRTPSGPCSTCCDHLAQPDVGVVGEAGHDGPEPLEHEHVVARQPRAGQQGRQREPVEVGGARDLELRVQQEPHRLVRRLRPGRREPVGDRGAGPELVAQAHELGQQPVVAVERGLDRVLVQQARRPRAAPSARRVAGHQPEPGEVRDVDERVAVRAVQPRRAEVDRDARAVDGPRAAADAIARLEHGHVHALRPQRARRAEPCRARARAPAPAPAAAAAAPRRTRARSPAADGAARGPARAGSRDAPRRYCRTLPGRRPPRRTGRACGARSTSWSTIGSGRSGAQRRT